MKEIVKYEAFDGTEFKSMEDCARHEQMCDLVSSAMISLVSVPDNCDFFNGKGYIQQNQDDVIEARKNIIQICKDYYPESFSQFSGDELPNSIIGRYIDDCCHTAIKAAWHRFICMDDSFREWGQLYFSLHPEKAEQICLNIGG